VAKTGDLRAKFRQAARAVTTPAPKPAARRRRRGDGNGGSRLTTSTIADSYLRLCQDPCKDLRRWIAEDPRDRALVLLTPTTEHHHDETTTGSPSVMEDARRLCGHPLHAMQGRLDAHREPGRSVDDLPAGSRTGALGHDQLRSLRATGECDLAGPSGEGVGIGLEFSAELGAVAGYFAARMGAARLADPNHHREAITSRPLLLQAIGRQTSHVGGAVTSALPVMRWAIPWRAAPPASRPDL
jgi:hypothetical protein